MSGAEVDCHLWEEALKAIEKDDIWEVKRLLPYVVVGTGEDTAECDTDLLCVAIKSRSLGAADALLSYGLRPDLWGCDGITPAHHAVAKDDRAALRLLDRYKPADRDTVIRPNLFPTSPLIAAASGASYEVTRYVMQAFPATSTFYLGDRSPIRGAIEEVLKVDNMDAMTALAEAVTNLDQDAIHDLVLLCVNRSASKGVDILLDHVELDEAHLEEPVFRSIQRISRAHDLVERHDAFETFRRLIDRTHESLTFLKSRSLMTCTPISCAIREKAPEVIDEFLDVHVPDTRKRGEQAHIMRLTLQWGVNEVLDHLIKRGIEPDIVDSPVKVALAGRGRDETAEHVQRHLEQRTSSIAMDRGDPTSAEEAEAGPSKTPGLI